MSETIVPVTNVCNLIPDDLVSLSLGPLVYVQEGAPGDGATVVYLWFVLFPVSSMNKLLDLKSE